MSHTGTQQNGWEETTLGEVAENISRSFDFSNKNNVVFVNTGDVLEGKFLHSNLSSKIGLPGQAKKAIKKDDILFSEIRPANKRYAIVNFDADDYVVSTKFMVIKRNKKVDLNFLYLFLTSQKNLQEFQIIAESRSGTFPQITFEAISQVPIILPPLPEQHAIASVLSSFDNKIELLRTQNKTLEDMAQAIFREWFVKFEFPNADRKPYKSSEGKMVESELGKIPEGWGTCSFYECAEYINGAAFKDADFSKHKEGLPVIKIVELKNGITDQTKFTTKKMASKYYIKDEDILFSWSGSPETSIDTFIWLNGDGVLNQHTFNVVPKNEESKTWLYFLLKHYKNFFIHLAKQKQTTGLGHVTVANLKENFLLFCF